MATTTTLVAKGAWAQIATGPLAVDCAADDSCHYAAAPDGAPPADGVIGYWRPAHAEFSAELATGEGLWVRNDTRAFRLSKDETVLA